MITFACETDDATSLYGIDHFIRTTGLSIMPTETNACVCIGYQAQGKGRFSVNIVQNPAVEADAGIIAIQNMDYPLLQVPSDTHEEGDRCIAEFRSEGGNYPCISGSGSGISIGFDLFRLTGTLLSGSLDAPGSRQNDDNCQSHAVVSPPLVDVYEDILFRAIMMGCSEIGIPLVRKSYWPSGKKYAVCLTHDVDEFRKTYQWVTRPLRCLKRHDAHGFFNQLKSFSLKIMGNEPYWTFEKIMQKEKELGVRSSYFFLKESGKKSLFQPESWHLYGRSHSLQKPGIIGLIRKLSEEGHEVGVHGSTCSYNNPALLKSEKAEIEGLLGGPVDGIRQHRLNLTIPDTWVYQSEAGFRYDTTLGFKAADGIGFRWGTCFPFHPGSPTGALPILEIPLSLMDITLQQGEEGWDVCKTMIQQVRSRGGVLTALWHPPVFNNLEYPEIGRWYWNIIETCIKDGAWVTNGREIATWWQAREAGAPEYRYDDDVVSISCDDSPVRSFDIYVPQHRSAELLSQNATLSKTDDGHYLLTSNTKNVTETLVVRLV